MKMQKKISALALVLVGGVTGAAHAQDSTTLTFRGNIEGGTCDLSAGDVDRTIDLPTVRVPDFVSSSHGGSETPFSLTATCDADVNQVTFTFGGTPLPAHNLLFNNTGDSTGVGLTLGSLIGGVHAPIHASNPATLSRTVQTVSSQAVLPLQASYWRVSAGSVTKGTFASAVTVDITYD